LFKQARKKLSPRVVHPKLSRRNDGAMGRGLVIEKSVDRRNPGRQDGVTGVAREVIGPTPVRRADLEEKANVGRSHPVAIVRKGHPVRGNLDGEVHGTQVHRVAIIRKGRLELGSLVGEVHVTVVHRVVTRGVVRVEIVRKRVRPTDLVEKVNVGQSHPVEIVRKGRCGQDGGRRALARHAGILIDDLKHVILVKVTMDRVDQEAKCVTNDHPFPMDEVRQATM
jgi:hypothetical protein